MDPETISVDTETIKPIEASKFDKMNKDIIPEAKEGYQYKYGKSGWR